MPDDEEIHRPRSFIRHVATVTLPDDQKIDMHLDEDPEEQDQALHDPIVYDTDDFDSEELAGGVKKELDSLRSFEVFEEVPVSECSLEELQNAYNYRWVHRR